MPARITAATPPEQWPQYLFVADMAVILDRAPRTIENRCALGQMQPAPVMTPKGDYVRPLRWKRVTVLHWLDGKADGVAA